MKFRNLTYLLFFFSTITFARKEEVKLSILPRIICKGDSSYGIGYLSIGNGFGRGKDGFHFRNELTCQRFRISLMDRYQEAINIPGLKDSGTTERITSGSPYLCGYKGPRLKPIYCTKEYKVREKYESWFFEFEGVKFEFSKAESIK